MSATESSHNVQFRDYRPDDRPQLTKMIFGLYQHDAEGQPMTVQKVHRTIERLSTHPDQGRIVIFSLDDEPIGYAILNFFWSNEFGGNLISVDELIVLKPYQSQSTAIHFL
jgi:hypothetical protein